jgi:hypothetical protein
MFGAAARVVYLQVIEWRGVTSPSIDVIIEWGRHVEGVMAAAASEGVARVALVTFSRFEQMQDLEGAATATGAWAAGAHSSAPTDRAGEIVQWSNEQVARMKRYIKSVEQQYRRDVDNLHAVFVAKEARLESRMRHAQEEQKRLHDEHSTMLALKQVPLELPIRAPTCTRCMRTIALRRRLERRAARRALPFGSSGICSDT